MLISKKAVQDFLERPLNSYTWMKRLTKSELEEELSYLTIKPEFKTEPWAHQLVAFFIGLSEKRFLFLLDMGAGKSKILLDLISYRKKEGKLKKALITVPRLINLGTWATAAAEHSNLTPVICSGSIAEKWEALVNPQGDFAVIDYAGLQLACSQKKGRKLVRDEAKMRQLCKVYNFLGIDESHKSKTKDTLRFGLMSLLSKNMDYVYATTGTLFGRNIEDIWSQFYLVDRGETFGETLGLFRSAYMREKSDYWKGSTWEFDKAKARALYRALQHKSLRYDESELADLPTCTTIQIKLRLTGEAREHYLRAIDGVINATGKLKDLDGAWIRMRQILSGYLQWKDEYGDHVIDFKDNPKLDMLEQIIEDAGDCKVIVCHDYTHSGQLIEARVKELGYGYEWLYGGTKDPIKCVDRFISDPSKKVFIMNSEAGGTGTDGLQKVAQYLVFFESPCSPITRKQTLKRIHRPGQKQRTFIYDLTMERTIDSRILGFIAEGKSMYDAVVNGKYSRDIFSDRP